uniref:Uncharacterized protein n=1 Tax=viral metagenome TaxID=1070528 RepID=A0A6H1ZBY5_9ZZZZ
MKPQDVLKKLQNLNRGEYDEASLMMIDAWAKSIEELEAKSAIAKLDVIQNMISGYAGSITGIDEILLFKRDLEPLERLNLLDRRELFQNFINSFDVDKQLNDLTTEINNNL